MSNEQKITTNIKVPNKDLETLKIHFPHYFDKNGNFDFEKFKTYLTEKEINFSAESYGLEWLGKSYARLLASDPATTLLKADETHNAKPENANSENLLIKGDNLEVLKHLANAYYEKVKMIYIDPPYNTGSDGFVYNDDRKYTVKELQNLIGIDEEKAKRILDFTKSKSNSHSAWLTFMYPRLYIAKQLLKDDGVIFVSIDDNEVAQLRLLMDEIFGEENFVAIYKWNKTSTPPSLSRKVRQKYEFVLCFEKRSNNKVFDGGITDGGDMPLLNDSNNIGILQFPAEKVNFKIKGEYKKGIYDRVELLTDIQIINGKADKDFKLKGPFKWTQDNLIEEIDNGTIFHIKSDKFAIRYEKEGERIKVPADIISKKECSVGTNEDANKELYGLFQKDGLFNYPKPTTLIKYLCKFKTENNDLILDFFAGSGTTGDAVMQLNAEDGGNRRKFILVQLPEAIDPKKNKTAYDFVKDELKAEPTIFEITKERLLRAAKKINAGLDEKIKKLQSEIQTEETKAEIEKLERLKKQNTFKVFQTTPIWEDYNFEAEQFDPSQTLFDAGKLTEDDIKELLTTWKTYDGIALTQELESVDLSGYTAYYGNGRLYLMNKGFTTNNLKALLEKIDTDKHFEPKSIIAFGYHLESKSLREISENVKTYNNKKKSDIDFITRY
ncbi:MAG: site-specific DNA-methyltransferase [Weeksellaceae bacterium]|jgi:adenine-specific DNA-methyltransferase|nr:site-specific DNA-methyltransferase [Weeksellaceae bacterium]